MQQVHNTSATCNKLRAKLLQWMLLQGCHSNNGCHHSTARCVALTETEKYLRSGEICCIVSVCHADILRKIGERCCFVCVMPTASERGSRRLCCLVSCWGRIGELMMLCVMSLRESVGWWAVLPFGYVDSVWDWERFNFKELGCFAVVWEEERVQEGQGPGEVCLCVVLTETATAECLFD